MYQLKDKEKAKNNSNDKEKEEILKMLNDQRAINEELQAK